MSFKLFKILVLKILAGTVFCIIFCCLFFGCGKNKNVYAVTDTWEKLGNYMDKTKVGAGYTEITEGKNDITAIIANVIRISLSFAGAIFFILFLFAAYDWLMSGGNEEKVGSAKKKIIHSVLGLVIILIAYMFVDFLILVFTGVAGI